MDGRYIWVLLQHSGLISGIYYESPNSALPIGNLGVTGDQSIVRAAPLIPKYLNYPDSNPIGCPSDGVFLSSAVLHDVRKIDVCRINARCTGMLLRYLNGVCVFLGQWAISLASKRFCIYKIEDEASISSLYFKMSRCGSQKIVTGISPIRSALEKKKKDGDQVFKVERVFFSRSKGEKLLMLVQHIAWWFSCQYDKIMCWEAVQLDIPEVTPKY
jgi:hypothetical protein